MTTDGFAERVRAAEEAAGFAEHAVQRLTADVAAMSRMLNELDKRLAAMEARVKALAAPPAREAPSEG